MPESTAVRGEAPGGPGEARDVSNVRAYGRNPYEARFVVRATILPVRAPVHVRTPGGGGLQCAQIIRARLLIWHLSDRCLVPAERPYGADAEQFSAYVRTYTYELRSAVMELRRRSL